jgi:type III pantothenate kinase
MLGAPELLTIDCGNSTIDCVRATAGERLRLATDAPELTQLAAFVAAAPLQGCMAVSVVPAALHRVRVLLERAAVPLRVAGVEVPCPLPLDYATPATLGADRWVGALAAHRLHGRAVVVDCGTATTVNVVDADGTFRGGPIAPGLRAMVLGMRAATPALPMPSLDAPPSMPPRSSQAAVDTGVLLGYCGMVERLVADAVRVARGPATIVITGGNAPRLLAHTRLHGVHAPDLVHAGLRLLAAAVPWSS